MKKFLLISTAFYFLIGNCLLPQGGFSALAQLPAMYQHCKTTEDPDINLADFIVEHLLNIEDTDAGDEKEHELPHNPLSFQTIAAPVFYCVPAPLSFSFEIEKPVLQLQPKYQTPYYPRLGLNDIFQPPRV